MRGWRFLSFFLALAFAIPELAANEEDDLEHNKQLLQKWKQDPEHYARLQADLKAFHELPRSRQEQLRQFDSDFAALTSQQQRRLWEVLERYNYWLERLPEADRQRILQITDPNERLALVRQLREQEWQDRLPSRTRDELRAALAKAPNTDGKAKILAQFKEQESKRHLRILRQAKNPATPARTDQLPIELKNYLDKHLKPQLSNQDREALNQAEGKYPQLLQTIYKLGETHPLLLAHSKAAQPSDFPAAVRTWIEKELLPKLRPEEKTALLADQKKWPDYPRKLHKLAHDHKIPLPDGLRLPGPHDMWDAALGITN